MTSAPTSHPLGRPVTRPLTGLVVRSLSLVVLLGAGSLAVHHLATSPVARLFSALRASSSVELFDIVTAGCGAALLACWVWCLLAAVAVAVDTVRAGSGHVPLAGQLHCPRLVYAVVLAVLGLGYAAAPSLAATGDGLPDGGAGTPPGVSGLALPERPLTQPSRRFRGISELACDTTPTTPRPAAAPAGRLRWVRVTAGDSLWSLSEGLLPRAATPADIDNAWRSLAGINARVIGDDPDLIFPGTLLRVPGPDSTVGKELP